MSALMRSLLFGLLLTALLAAAKPVEVDEATTTEEPAISTESKDTSEDSNGKLSNEEGETRIHAFARSYINGDREDTRLARPSFQACVNTLVKFTWEGKVLLEYVTSFDVLYEKDFVCDLQEEAVLPFVCLAKKYCDEEMAAALFLGAYSYGQILLGNEQEEQPLNCEDRPRGHDLSKHVPELTNATIPSELLPQDLCKDVRVPKFQVPRRAVSSKSEEESSKPAAEDELKTAEEAEEN
ncbi:hypothetical protein M3Y99_00812700 [Aphelenchoides fujianensis]|nr:hypothetical protein M3Y99_00812700 [Aphelenchoides fujianensis]